MAEDLASVLQAIASFPDNETLRWRAATLFEQQGDRARARFIRLQLQIAELSDAVDDPNWLAMMDESMQLVESHAAEWNERYRDLEAEYFEYDRGFIELVGLRAANFLNPIVRQQLFARLPLRHVDITHLDHVRLEQVLAISELGTAASLGLDRLKLSDNDMKAFDGPKLLALRWLSLRGNEITFEGVSILTELWRRTMPQLEVIELTGNPYDPANEIAFDQHVALAWRPSADPREIEAAVEQAPWLAPRIVDGRVEPLDRLAFGRPTRSRETEINPSARG